MRGARAVVLAMLASMAPGVAIAFDDGGAVAYHPFGAPTTTVVLQQHRGRYVELLLSPEWESALTTQERRTILDRADLVYQFYKEILQAEPAGGGLYQIAVFPGVPAKAHALIPGRVMEIRADDDNLSMFKEELAAGLETNRNVLIHEMGHSFDLVRDYLEYEGTCGGGTDWCHAWTDLWDAFIPFYGRFSGIRERVPSPALDLTGDGHQRWWTDHSYLPYYLNPSANWTNAVKSEGFLPGITARDTWAGVVDRLVQLYGPEVVLDAMAFVQDYAAVNPAPTTPEEKEHLRIRALAAGAQANLSCFLDEWRWYTSATLRAELAADHGPAASNAFCQDADGDGFTPLQGDCDDAAASVNPAVAEAPNGVDDDCNGLVDDMTPLPPVAVPLAPWAATAPPGKDGVAYVLRASALRLAPPYVSDPPTHVRFWVTGMGVVGTVPFASEVSLRWTPPVGLAAGTYGYRAQLLSGTLPVSDFTPIVWFDHEGPCASDADCDDGDACSVDACTSSGQCSNIPITDRVYEAEAMNHSVGNAYPGGWNIYGNGYVSFQHAFPGGMETATVRAAGQYGQGWPNMQVTVNGVQVFSGTVQATAWTDYTFSFFAPPASSEVRVHFTNDFFSQPAGQPTVDRNLLVDKVTLAPHCGPGTTPAPINLGPVNAETRFTAVGPQPLVVDQLTFSGWTPRQIVVGIGHTDAQTLAGVSVSVNGGAPIALAGDWRTIVIPFTGQAVIHLTVYAATPRALRTQWWAE